MTLCKRSRIVIVAMYSRDNRYIRQFMSFDDVCAKTFIHQIVALTFKHVLILFLTIINHICDLSLTILSYIKSLFCF